MSAAIARLAEAIGKRYRVERELGAGGMATVHLARDLKHERDVAIKVLHPDLAAALGSDRFLAEIRTTAKLQHPHILPLLDSGAVPARHPESESRAERGDGEGPCYLFYVMPAVTGESLRQRLERERQLPIDDALRIAREVASALDYAHRQGVVHRDIKPENILLHEGSAMVADFGIALAVQSAGGQRMTQTGLSLGTPQYMSPEQAMGERTIDARSDIYSLAAVTYEMLTGEPPFTGATVQAVVAKVISAEPQDIAMTRRNVSPSVSLAVHRGLEKLPADRHASAAAFAAALSETAHTQPTANSGSMATRSGAGSPSLTRSAAPWVAAGLLGMGAFALGRTLPSRNDGDMRGPVMATLLPDEGEEWSGSGVHFSLSADGRRVAMVVNRGGETEMIIRSLDSLGSQRLRNTKGAFYPFWSPDGRVVGFFADNQLKTIDLTTGSVRALCPAVRPGGASWGANNRIIFVPERGVGLHQVSSSGGACAKLGVATPAPALDGKPRFLADGRHFVASTDLAAWLGEVGGDSLTKLVDLPRMRAVVAGPDYLLYRPEGSPSRSIFAQRIDVKARKLAGEPVRILDDVPNPGGNTALSASNNGVIVARLQDERGEGAVIARFERSGAIRDTINASDVARTFGPRRLSRDGRRLALGGWEIAVLDLTRQVATTLARSPLSRPMQFPVWSPLDTMIAFVTGDSGGSRIDVVDTRTSQVRTLLTGFTRGRSVELTDWSADGRFLAYQYGAGGGSAWFEGWVYDLVKGESRRLFEEDGHVVDLQIDPRGRLIAYQVGRGSAEPAIFVRPFPGPGTPSRVSPNGGGQVRWSRDGSELFYNDRAGVMAVQVGGDGSVVSAPRVALDIARLRSISPNFGGNFLFDPTPDGQAFVGSVVRPRPVNLTVLIDWWKLLPADSRPWR